MKALKVMVMVVVLVIAVSVIAGLGSLGNKVNHDQATADSVKANWSSVTIGMSESEVRSMLGKPSDVSTTTSAGLYGGTDTLDMWMYGTLASTTYSLDFDNGKLTDKSTL